MQYDNFWPGYDHVDTAVVKCAHLLYVYRLYISTLNMRMRKAGCYSEGQDKEKIFKAVM